MAKSVKLEFGGAEREFRLAIGQLRELQEACKAGPATILARLMSFQPQAEDVKRPRSADYETGELDPDFLSDWNIYSLLRNVGGDWRTDDVRETLRLGLIGGGETPTNASVMVARYVDNADEWVLNVALASQVLIHALVGEQDDKVGKPKAETDETKATVA